MTTKHYTCAICRATNSAVRLHCQICGTIPAEYSVIGTTAREIDTAIEAKFIPVVVAHGAERLDHSRTCKTSMRTVPLDYYAEEK